VHPDVEPFAEVSTLVAGSVALQDLLDRYVMTVNLQDAGTDAIVRLRMLVDEYPDNHKVRSGLADLLIDAGRVNEGVRELRTIAQHYETIGDLTAMVDSMRRISSAVPTNTEIKTMLIDVYTRRGILDEALRELEILAGLYLERGNAADSVKCFTRAAEIACAMGDFQHGNSLYDQGVAADPNNVPVRHAAVAFYLQTGAVSRAADQLREVVRIALLEEDPDEAIAALHQIIGLAPEDTDAYHKLGEVLTSIGEYSQAERVYRRMAQFAPDDPVLTAKQSALAVLAATR
jgi:tetratricopeptide (TPR) repeat protein